MAVPVDESRPQITYELTMEACTIYTRIRTKLADASAMPGAQSATATATEARTANLQKDFYSLFKRWMASKVNTVQESELDGIKKLMGDFESRMSNLEGAVRAGDEDDVNFFTVACEIALNHCKSKYSL